MKFNGLTQALQHLLAGISAGGAQMQSVTGSILWSFVTIEIVMLGVWMALGGEQLTALLKKFLGLGVWVWLVREFPSLAKTFVESLVSAGLVAGGRGGGFGILLDPSRIAATGLEVTAPFLKTIDAVPMLNVADKLVYYLCYLVIMLMFVLMACNVFFAVAEYYMFLVLASVLMPFSINPHTRFIADKGINMVLACGIKLMVLSFVLALVQPILSDVRFTGTDAIEWNELWAVILTVGAVAMLAFKAPSSAAAMIHGSPSLSSSGALLGAAGAVVMSTVETISTAAHSVSSGFTKNTDGGGGRSGGDNMAAATRVPGNASSSYGPSTPPAKPVITPPPPKAPEGS